MNKDKVIRKESDIQPGKKYLKSSAGDYINDGIIAWELCEDHAEETCYFGHGDCICNTCRCAWNEENPQCNHYFEG